MMATRSGDLDPSLPGFLARSERVSVDQVEDWLNTRSGLLGVSGRSGDMRELLARAEQGDERCDLAVEAFCYRARKYVGAYLAALSGADAIVFGGGIGENAPDVRAGAAQGLKAWNVALDPGLNLGNRPGRISRDGTRPVYVFKTREEAMIATALLIVPV